MVKPIPSAKTPSKALTPYWVYRLPPSIFPRGPRSFYAYLCSFPTGCCYLFSYRLAAKFHVSERTIRRWRSWLRKHHLCHTWWESSTRPRIICHHYASFYSWITEMALPKPTKFAPKLHLTIAQKEARRQAFIAQLFSTKGRT